MAVLSTRGRIYVAEIVSGDYASDCKGITDIAIYGSTGGAADAIIGSLQALTWVTGSPSSVYTSGNYIFTVPADTVVKGFVMFTDDIATTVFDTDNVVKEEFDTYQSFTNAGTITLTNIHLSVSAGGAMTTAGKIAIYKVLGGDYDGVGYAGWDKVGISGSIDGAASDLIGSVQSTVWGTASVTVSFSADKDFTIADENTEVERVLLFETTDGITYGDELASYQFVSPYLFENVGVFTIDSLSYGVV